MRNRAIYMIFRLASAYHASMETVSHAIVLLDRMIAKSSASSDFVTIAIACFLIASKLLETQNPSLQDLAELGFCSVNQVRAAEINVLAALDWDVHVETKEPPSDTTPLSMAAPAL